MNEAEKIIALLEPEQVGRNLRLARKKQEMTQEEAAQCYWRESHHYGRHRKRRKKDSAR